MVPSRAYRTEGLDGVSLGFRNQIYHFNIGHDYLPGCFLDISDPDALPFASILSKEYTSFSWFVPEEKVMKPTSTAS